MLRVWICTHPLLFLVIAQVFAILAVVFVLLINKSTDLELRIADARIKKAADKGNGLRKVKRPR